jgi:hypothetical protein
MSRHERTQLSVEMERELELVDAAIRGEAVAGADAPLAELACRVHALRPRPSEEFARALDARASRGFVHDSGEPAPAGGSPRRRWPAGGRRPTGSGGRRRLPLLPAAGLGLAVVLAVALTISLSGSGGHRMTPTGGGPVAAGPAGVSPVKGVQAHADSAVAAQGTSNAGRTTGAVPGTPASAAPARQVERTSTLDVGVAADSTQSASHRVFTLVSAFGGYVRQSSVSSGGPGQVGATFDIRIPSSKLAAAIAALADLGHVRSENDTTNDVTDQLGSLQRSLGGLRAERASLLRQLAAASDAQQAARLQTQLHDLEARIARVQGDLRSLTTRIDYTSLALSLTAESSTGTASGDLTPGKAAHEAVRILDAALAVLVIGAAVVLPLALAIVAAWIAIALLRRRLREHALDAS